MPSISACHLVLFAYCLQSRIGSLWPMSLHFLEGTWYQDEQWSAETCAQIGKPWDNFPLSKSRATMEIFTIDDSILDLHMFFNSWKTQRANSSNSSNWMHVRIVTCSYICQDGYLDEIQSTNWLKIAKMRHSWGHFWQNHILQDFVHELYCGRKHGVYDYMNILI